jgi:hypothetical protein
VRIVDANGGTVSTRVSRDEADARLYASTVRQHIGWLSPEQFERYYAIDAEGS